MATSTDTSSPSSVTKVAQAWTSVFGSGLKRSRSLTGINKSTVEGMQSNASLVVYSNKEERSPKKSSMKLSPSANEANGLQAAIVVSPVTPPSASPPTRPKPAPHLWEEFPTSGDSLAGLETPVAPTHTTSPLAMNPPCVSPLFPARSSSASPKGQSPLSKYSPKMRDGSLSRRRKEGVVDLALVPVLKRMTTVEECSIDSPTIPEHHTNNRRTPRASPLTARGCLTPRAVASDPQLSESHQSMEPLTTPEWKERSQRRASSMLLPIDLAPLVIPTRTPPLPPPEAYRNGPIPSADPSKFATPNEDDVPPKVPPKSPRTLTRAFPAARPTLKSTASTPSISHTASSSITSINSLDTQITPFSANRPWSPLAQIPNPRLQMQEKEVYSSPAEMASINSWTTQDQIGSSTRFLRAGFSLDDSTSQLPLGIRKTVSTQSLHQRVASENSVMNRGRPMKRGDVSIQRGISRGLKLALINDTFEELPTGQRNMHAANVIPQEELLVLRKTAETLALSFEILTQIQIEELNQELCIIEENCGHIRHTVTGLREERKSVREHMRGFLSISSNIAVTRETLIKQESMLANLDLSIDEWTAKLEKIEGRQWRIQQKLSQHMAAVLLLQVPGSETRRISEEQTPPRSPERLVVDWDLEESIDETGIERETRRDDVESIRIYAGSGVSLGVASLLKSIEQEIDLMGQRRNHSPV